MKQVWNNHISSAHCACRIPNTNKYQFRLSTARAQQAGWLPGAVPAAGSLKSSHVLTVPYFSRNKDCTGCNSTLQKADGSSKYWWVSPDVTVVAVHFLQSTLAAGTAIFGFSLTCPPLVALHQNVPQEEHSKVCSVAGAALKASSLKQRHAELQSGKEITACSDQV